MINSSSMLLLGVRIHKGVQKHENQPYTIGNKVCDFHSVSLEDEALPKWGLLLQEKVHCEKFP